MPDLLRAEGVSFSYHATPVLREVSVALPAGGFLGILGPNGSGKTTLLRTLSGTLRPMRGHVLLEATDLASIPRRTLARRMAVVPQETHLAFRLRFSRSCDDGPVSTSRNVPDQGRVTSRCCQALSATGTLALEDQPFDTLSGAKRVIIAAALLQIRGRGSDGILLLDEPTVALDLAYQLERTAAARTQARVPIAIAISTHDLNFAAGLCRTMVLLKEGRVLAAGPTDEVLTADHIRRLYDVDADVTRHAGTGRIVVVPVRRASAEARK
jgi:iron complex transport system ATP-binding protein